MIHLTTVKSLARWLALSAIAIPLACGGGSTDNSSASPSAQEPTLQGTVRLDGSSTVFPISEAVAEEFRAVAPDVRVTVGVSGTGGGFQKFIHGETDINDASRAVKAEELAAMRESGIDVIELPVAYDGITVMVHPTNDFATSITVEELNQIWAPGSAVQRWSDVRPEWPDRELHLYGPGPDSGTFDYFTDEINGEEGACRPDYTASEDDNTLVQGIAGDPDALGFFGFAYYEQNTDKLQAIAVDDGSGPVLPATDTINDGSYAPLSRPLFIYVSTNAADRPEVEAFIEFYLENAAALAREVGYVPMPESTYELAKERYAGRVSGSVYEHGEADGRSIEELMRTHGG